MIVLQLLRINTLEESRLSHLIADIVASEPSSVMENTQQLDGKFLSYRGHRLSTGPLDCFGLMFVDQLSGHWWWLFSAPCDGGSC